LSRRTGTVMMNDEICPQAKVKLTGGGTEFAGKLRILYLGTYHHSGTALNHL